MRLDKFLKVSRLIKRRTIANEACDAGRVMINQKVAKASSEVKVGDEIEAKVVKMNDGEGQVQLSVRKLQAERGSKVLEDAFENMGAALVKEVATKTNDAAGDGTTTATLLAQALVREGMKNIAAGANPMVVMRGMQKAVDAAVEEI